MAILNLNDFQMADLNNLIETMIWHIRDGIPIRDKDDMLKRLDYWYRAFYVNTKNMKYWKKIMKEYLKKREK